jgi:hypothetical protein
LIEAHAAWLSTYKTFPLAFAAVVLLVGGVWFCARLAAARHREIVRHLAELRRLQEAQAAQIGSFSQIIEACTARSYDQGCIGELRRLLGDVFAVAFQISAVEQARSQHPEIDLRVMAQLKERGIALISRIGLFADYDHRTAQELVAMLRRWILDPKPDHYAEWERAATQLALHVIRAQRPAATNGQSLLAANFTEAAAAA